MRRCVTFPRFGVGVSARRARLLAIVKGAPSAAGADPVGLGVALTLTPCALRHCLAACI